MNRRLTRVGNRIGVWLYRRSDGRLGSGRHEVDVVLLTTPGRRSGIPRSTCVRFLRVPDGLLVWGTGAGAPRDPDWFENLRVADVVDVQVGADSWRAHPREIHDEEREAVWRDTILAQVPEVAKYARRAGRVIPVALLKPLA